MKQIIALLALALSSLSLTAHADCFNDAAAFHHVNPLILRAIAQGESSNNPLAIHKNTNGTVDIGYTQTNSVHFKELAEYGIKPNDLLNACNSIYIAGWLLRKKINKHGNTWAAVGAYHSETPSLRDKYAAKIRAIVSKWSAQ